MRAIIRQAMRQLEHYETLPLDERLEDWEPSIQWIINSVEREAFKLGYPAVVEACQIPGRGLRWAKRVLATCLESCPEPEPDLLTVKQAAARFNVGERTLYRLVEQNRIPHRRIGTSIRFKPSDLESRLGKRKGRLFD